MSELRFVFTLILFLSLALYVHSAFVKDVIVPQVLKAGVMQFNPPTCTMGFIIVDGLLRCAWSWLSFYYQIFDIGSYVVWIQTIFIASIFVLGIILIRILRGA